MRVRAAAAAGGGSDPLGNLGQLARVASQPGVSSDEAAMLQLADPASFSERGLYVDGGSVFASVVLLLLMLGFSFNRILGLDRFVKQAAVAWKERRQDEQRREIMDARVKLLKMMEDEDGSQGSGDQGKTR